MTVFRYNQLSEQEQLKTLHLWGVLIGEREGSFYHLELYQINGFYVELCYHMHFNTLITINAFSNTDCLDPYLKQINIDELMPA